MSSIEIFIVKHLISTRHLLLVNLSASWSVDLVNKINSIFILKNFNALLRIISMDSVKSRRILYNSFPYNTHGN